MGQANAHNPATQEQMINTITKELFAISPKVQLAFPMIVHGLDLSEAEETLSIDLNQELSGQPGATFISHARDDSLSQMGIYRGDQLIIDRKLRPQNNDVVLACVDGELLCRLLDLENGLLRTNEEDIPTLALDEHDELLIIGVVTHNIRSFR